MNNACDWPELLGEQLSFHWSRLARPRLDGLVDWEYFGEPVPGCWNLRPHVDTDGKGGNVFVMDTNTTDEDPPPFTTIAWRLAHVIRHVLGARTHDIFDGPDAERVPPAATASDALAQLDDAYRRWQDGVSAMTTTRLAEPCGRNEPHFEDEAPGDARSPRQSRGSLPLR